MRSAVTPAASPARKTLSVVKRVLAISLSISPRDLLHLVGVSKLDYKRAAAYRFSIKTDIDPVCPLSRSVELNTGKHLKHQMLFAFSPGVLKLDVFGRYSKRKSSSDLFVWRVYRHEDRRTHSLSYSNKDAYWHSLLGLAINKQTVKNTGQVQLAVTCQIRIIKEQ